MDIRTKPGSWQHKMYVERLAMVGEKTLSIEEFCKVLDVRKPEDCDAPLIDYYTLNRMHALEFGETVFRLSQLGLLTINQMWVYADEIARRASKNQ